MTRPDITETRSPQNCDHPEHQRRTIVYDAPMVGDVCSACEAVLSLATLSLTSPAPAAEPQQGEPSTEAGRSLMADLWPEGEPSGKGGRGFGRVFARDTRRMWEQDKATILEIEAEARASAPAAEPDVKIGGWPDEPDELADWTAAEPQEDDDDFAARAQAAFTGTFSESSPAEPQEGEPSTEAGRALLDLLEADSARPFLRSVMASNIADVEAEARTSAPAAEPAVTEALRDGVIDAAKALVAAWDRSIALWSRAGDDDAAFDEISASAADRIDKPEAVLREAVAALAASPQSPETPEPTGSGYPTASPLDVERLARALHTVGFVWNEAMDGHSPFEECFCADARREDAESLAAAYEAAEPTTSPGAGR